MAYSIKPFRGERSARRRDRPLFRMIQPLENWTLICDENLTTTKKICNITQSIVDGDGQMAFSWSLAATEGGKPMMVLRTRPELGQNKPVTLKFPGRDTPVIAETYACNSSVCIALLPVGPVMREQMPRRPMAQIAYEAGPEAALAFGAPLDGLAEALAVIK